jgi:hypothetical protein
MGSEMGPFTSSQLVEMARSHQLTPEDFVKKGAEGTWVDASRVKGLFEDGASSSIIRAHVPPNMKEDTTRKAKPADDAPANSPAAVTWNYISDHNKVGPLKFDELIAHGKQGLLKPTDRVWSSRSPKWCEAQQIDGLVF